MADFATAYERMMTDEGGYKLHQVEGDKGGMTYAGIARNKNPGWDGWSFIDRGEVPPSQMVRAWYHTNYWLPIHGDSIGSQPIANSIFNFAVNAGTAVAVKLAQLVVGATPDGVLGTRTIAALNA